MELPRVSNAAAAGNHQSRPRPLSKAECEAKKRDLELENSELKVELKRQKIKTEIEAQETLRYSRQMMKELVDNFGKNSQVAKASNSIRTIGNNSSFTAHISSSI